MPLSNSPIAGSVQSSGPQRLGRWAEDGRLIASKSGNHEEAIECKDAHNDAIYSWNDGSGTITSDQEAHPDVSGRLNVPLDRSNRCIRLAQLITRDDDVVEYTLHVHPISLAPPFFALSYAWGPPLPTKTIILNGRGFDIRENLWTALQCVKHAHLGGQNRLQDVSLTSLTGITGRSLPVANRFLFTVER